ncbi:MAG TPA: DMT family transporter [Alphaproteobacteria bacterium]|jgi:drug/metabolite transporter (DMT)-like permease|nr:DMT family transporter [Alphaproteobacteria bacterium]
MGRAVTGAILAVLLWAGYYLITRFGLAHALTVDDLVAARYVVPGALLLPVAWRLGISARGIGRLGWWKVVCLTATGGLQFGWFVTAGLQFAPAAQATMFTSAGVPLFVVLLAWPFLRELPTRGQVFGILLIVGGDALVVSKGLAAGGGELLGQIMFVLAGLGWAIYTLLVRRWRVDGLLATTAISVGSGAVFLPYYLLFGTSNLSGSSPVEIAFQLVYMGALVGIGATLAYTAAVKVLGAQRAALTTALVPACVALLGIPLLGEIPTAAEVAGVVAVTLGMPFALGWRPRRSR